jgi:hypothetical protein
MKRVMLVFFITAVAFCFIGVEQANSETYYAKPGDTAHDVVNKLGHSQEQLLAMNPGVNLDSLKPDQPITWISPKNQKQAVQYCYNQKAKLLPDALDQEFYSLAIVDLQDWSIDYGNGEGMPWRVLLAFSDGYEQDQG